MKRVKRFLYFWIIPHWSYYPCSWSDPKFRSQLSLDSFPTLPQEKWISKTCQLDLQIILWLDPLLTFTIATSSKASSATWTSATVSHQPLGFHCGLSTVHSPHTVRKSVDKRRLDQPTLLLTTLQLLLIAKRINSKPLSVTCKAHLTLPLLTYHTCFL